MGDERVTVVERFYRALRTREWDAIAELFAPDAEFGISGRNPLAGIHRGADGAIDTLRRLIEETDDTLGPVREDTWDVCVSDHHVILIEWLQATRKGRTARFYVHLVCALEDGKLKRAFATFDSQYDFDELW
ncbi:MAG: nuclear transport factor 2 family protein [bacterium]